VSRKKDKKKNKQGGTTGFSIYGELKEYIDELYLIRVKEDNLVTRGEIVREILTKSMDEYNFSKYLNKNYGDEHFARVIWKKKEEREGESEEEGEEREGGHGDNVTGGTPGPTTTNE